MNGPLQRKPNPRELLAAWRDEPLDRSARDKSDEARQINRAAAVLRGIAARRQRRTRWTRAGAGLAVAAAVAAGVVGAWSFDRQGVADRVEGIEPGVRVVSSQNSLRLTNAAGTAVARDVTLVEGTALETAEAPAEIAFASGARTHISNRAVLNIIEAGRSGSESILLSRGRVEVDVPERVRPQVFSVRTPDALVVVHGTRFSVEVARGLTRVAVTRGVVAVTSGGKEVRLTAGDEWPPPVVSAPVVPDPVPAPAETSAQASERKEPARAAQSERVSKASAAHRARQARAGGRGARYDSTLSEENRLFSLAMAKKKAGNPDSALSDVEAFIARHPDSVLSQEAEVERFRLLHRLGRTRDAAQRARQYLGDYRDGYARDEARDVALERP